MNKKQLISSEGVRAAAKRGDQVIYLQDKSTIVTSEAASTAKALGITLELKKPPSEPPPDLKDSEQGETAIRRVLAAHTGGEIREDLLAEVMRRVALERASQASVQGTVQTQGSGAVRKLALGFSTAEKSTLAGGRGTGWHSSSSRNAFPRKVAELRPGCE